MAALVGAVSALAGTAVGSIVLNIGASIALSLAARALTGSVKSRSPVTTDRVGQETRITTRQALPYQRLLLGTVTTAGALFFQRSSPPYIWQGYLLGSHRCDGLEAVSVAGKTVGLDANGVANTPPFHDGTKGLVEVSFRNGDSEQEIDRIIARDFGDIPASFRQRGHTTAVVKFHYGDDDDQHQDVYGSSGGLDPLFRIRGARVPDPRRAGVSLTGEDDTWRFDDNLALGLVRYLIHPWPRGRILEPDQIDWDKVAIAADECGKWVGKADGTKERRYSADGVIFANEDPFQVVPDLLSAAAAELILDKGKYHIVPGLPREPIATFHQDMLAGGFEYQAAAQDRDLANIVKTEFIAPDRDYQTMEGPVLKRDDLIAIDGRPLERTVPLRFTEGHTRAQRLASIALEKGRRGRALSAPFTVEAAKRKAGDVVRVDFRDFPNVGGLYAIRRLAHDSIAATVHVDLVAHDNAVFDWHAPTDEQTFEVEDLSQAGVAKLQAGKTTNTLNPLGEGGEEGQLCVCLVRHGTVSDRTPPAGWTHHSGFDLLDTVTNTSGCTVYSKVLAAGDDDEVTLGSFGSVDSMHALFYETAGSPVFATGSRQMTNSAPSNQSIALAGRTAPVAAIAWAGTRGTAPVSANLGFSVPAPASVNPSVHVAGKTIVKQAAWAAAAPDMTVTASMANLGEDNHLISLWIEL